MSAEPPENRLDRLRLAFGLGKPVDMSELGSLVAELRAGADPYLEVQLLHAHVLFGQDRFADCVAILEHVLSIYPTSDEARIDLASALMHKAIQDARATLAKVAPETLNANNRLAYWTHTLFTEVAAWDVGALSATIDRIPARDRRNPLLRPVLEGAKAVLRFLRSGRRSRSRPRKRTKS